MSNALLIRRRGMMMAQGGGGLLPPGYTQVSSVYGRVSRAKFIIVPTPDDNTEIYLEAKKSRFVSYISYFGNYIDESHDSIRMITKNSDTGFYANINNITSSSVSGNGSCLDWHTFLIKRTGENKETLSLTIDGVEYTNTAAHGTSNTNPVYLNSSSASSTLGGVSDTTYFRRVRVSSNGVLLRDYYPCVNPSNVVGFYDVVRGVFDTTINSSYPFYVGT